MLNLHQKAAAWDKTPSTMSFEESEYVTDPALYESLDPSKGFDLEKLGATQHLSEWKDVEQKAKRIIDSGGVDIWAKEPRDPNNPLGAVSISGQIIGDNGVHKGVVLIPSPAASTVISWNCSCTWGEYRRPGLPNVNPDYYHVWERYSGRVCSHILSLYWRAQDYRQRIDFSDVDPEIMRAAAPALTEMGALPLEIAKQYADDASPIDPAILEGLEPGETTYQDILQEEDRERQRLLRQPMDLDEESIALQERIDESFNAILDPEYRVQDKSRGIFDTDETETYKKEIKELEQHIVPWQEQISLIDGVLFMVAINNQGELLDQKQLLSEDYINNIERFELYDKSKHDGKHIILPKRILEHLLEEENDAIKNNFFQTSTNFRKIYSQITGGKNWENLDDNSRKEFINRLKIIVKNLRYFSNHLQSLSNPFKKNIEDRRKIIYREQKRNALTRGVSPDYYRQWLTEAEKEKRYWQYYKEYTGSQYLEKFESDFEKDPMMALQNSLAERMRNRTPIEQTDRAVQEQTKYLFAPREEPEEDQGFSPEEGPRTSNFSFISSEFDINDITIYLQNEIGNGDKPPGYARREMWGEQRAGLCPHPSAVPVSMRPDGNLIYSQDDLGYHPELGEMGHTLEERGTYGAIPVGEEIKILSVHPKDRMILIEYDLGNPSPNHQHIHLWVPIKDVDLI